MKIYDIFTVREQYPSENDPTASKWVYDQVVGLKKYDIQALVISPTPYIPFFLRKQPTFLRYAHHNNTINDYKGTQVIRPSFLKFPKRFFYSITQRNFSRAILKGSGIHKAKLIHAHFGQDGVAALHLKRKSRIPLVTTFYGGDIKRFVLTKPDLYKELIVEGDLFLAISKVMINDLKKLGFSKKNIQLWHLGIDLDKFQPKVMKKGKMRIRFLSVSRFSESKGLQYGLIAFQNVHKIYPDTEYIIVGFGPYEKHLKNLATQLKLNNSVKFINNLECADPRGVVVEQMKNADVLIHPTTPANNAREGTPLVLMEAQACETPCISTDFAGIPEVVIDKKTGFIISPFDTEKLEEKMIHLIEYSSVREAFGKSAREHVQKEFNQEKQIKKLVGIYKELMG